MTEPATDAEIEKVRAYNPEDPWTHEHVWRVVPRGSPPPERER